MWNKKKGKRKENEEEKEKYETDFSKGMAADGGERIRTFCSLTNREILESSISAFFFYTVYIYIYVCVCVLCSVPVFVKNANEKN